MLVSSRVVALIFSLLLMVPGVVMGSGEGELETVKTRAFGPQIFEPLTSRTNPDGTNWTVLALRDPGALRPLYEAQADMLADAAVSAYTQMVGENRAPCAPEPNPTAGNWGMEVNDVDCELTIVLRGSQDFVGPALASADRDQVRIDVWLHFPPGQVLFGWYLDPTAQTDEDFALALIAHELFHHFQFAKGGTFLPSHVMEGQARLAETLILPDLLDQETSPWYSKVQSAIDPVHALQNGIDAWSEHPDLPLCSRSYDAGLFWGYMYQRYDGIATIRAAIIDEGFVERRDCNGALYDRLDRVVAAASGDEEGLADVLIDLGVAAELGPVEWASPGSTDLRDWTRHMRPIERQNLATEQAEGAFFRTTEPLIGNMGLVTGPAQLAGQTVEETTVDNATRFWAGAGAHQYVDLPSGLRYRLDLVSEDDDWRHAVVLREPGEDPSVVPVPANGSIVLEPGPMANVVLVSARVAPTQGWFGVEATPELG